MRAACLRWNEHTANVDALLREGARVVHAVAVCNQHCDARGAHAPWTELCRTKNSKQLPCAWKPVGNPWYSVLQWFLQNL